MLNSNYLNLDFYDYNLPLELIAQDLADPSDNCQLLLCNQKNNQFELSLYKFKDIINLIDKNSVIFFNNSQVIKSRIYLENATIITSGGNTKILSKGEIFWLQNIDDSHFEALVYPGKIFQINSQIYFQDQIFQIQANSSVGRIMKHNIKDIFQFLDKYGNMPLPPYIDYNKNKESSYQTFFGDKLGSTAAPTASLHFTLDLFQQLQIKGIKIEYLTLHIGLGTFKLVNTANITDYQIHPENIEIDLNIFDKIAKYKSNNQKIISVGTTSTRTLESLPYLWKYLQLHHLGDFNLHTINYWNQIGATISQTEVFKFILHVNYINNINNNHLITFASKLYIYPGYQFLIIDELITNFHLPKSSLLMLVAAFIGYENMKEAYQYAIQQKLKFYSFGDAMYIKPN